jgi:hypothetical protein
LVTVKNLSILIILCLILVSCVTPSKPKEVIVPKIEPVPFTISEVSIDRKEFNPSEGETVTISYRISKPAKAIIKIFDTEMRLARDLMAESTGDSYLNEVIWDGRDLEGNTVPDEAYFFTVEATDYHGNFIFYDPTTISGGEFFIPEVNFDRGENRLSYQLPKDARVKIRAGISQGGPLLKNILNWTPRLSGQNEEIWDGKDGSKNIDAVSQKGYGLMAEAVSLPENSILTYGNIDYDYFKYKNDIAPERPKKVERPLFQSKTVWQELQPVEPVKLGPEPKFRIDLPENIEKTENGLPIVEGKTPIKIYLDEKIKRYVTEQRYEIIFFVDFKFVTEMEEGYSPFTLIWDSRNVPNGEHIIIVNVATFTGQVSSASMRVMVEN